MTTKTTEDYLSAIWKLRDKRELSVTALAKHLRVSKPSVTEMLGTLRDLNYVNYKAYGNIILTKKGESLAEKVVRKHRITESFLKDMLKIKGEKIHVLADKLEHAFDEECIDKIYKLLGKPKLDPHGSIIPKWNS